MKENIKNKLRSCLTLTLWIFLLILIGMVSIVVQAVLDNTGRKSSYTNKEFISTQTIPINIAISKYKYINATNKQHKHIKKKIINHFNIYNSKEVEEYVDIINSKLKSIDTEQLIQFIGYSSIHKPMFIISKKLNIKFKQKISFIEIDKYKLYKLHYLLSKNEKQMYKDNHEKYPINDKKLLSKHKKITIYLPTNENQIIIFNQ